ncbi:phospholipid carrier-dependent glycosyltransferase [Phytohabitans aurantiacus]|uniref:Glycosyl transferase n=1 Tax=Phytohabitans aurantiacus TaxID=3016789 RepID=A0ABQ5QYS5_9ACTN|nr:phospholipid carrier-dependent glycosyltransferase [Phytohabitans aurantiacus]GLH99579.1 glycosyl transferase [Phytohabitans aurantiacus]
MTTTPRWLRRGLLALAVAALLAQMAAAMLTTAVGQTSTIDEPVYAGAALVQLQERSLRYNPEHPPLGKLIIGAGLSYGDARIDPGFVGNQTELGRWLQYESGQDPARTMLLARLPVIVMTLLFGLVVFGFARDVAGWLGGLAALTLYAFSPDVIAHGSLATLDALVSGFLITALWMVWRARRRPLPYLPLAGLALGAALATKMSALAGAPVVLALATLSVWHATRQSPGEASSATGGIRVASGQGARGAGRRRVLAVGVAAAFGVGLIAVGVVWASYLAVDPDLVWVAPPDLPAVHGLRALLVDALPFPQPYRDGMRVQFGFEDGKFGGYLFGRNYSGSLWYYQPAALLVKTPLGMLALWLAGVVAMLSVRRLRAAAPYVLLPAAVLLAAAMTGDRDFGTRYTLFMPMLLAVAAAAVAVVPWRPGLVRAAMAALVLFVAISSLRTFPYYLPYSNEAFGGPSKTYLRLHDSNVDWGQDLGRLAERLRTRYPDEQIWLVYRGSGEPDYYEIKFRDPLRTPPDEVRGLLVVSNSTLAKAINGPLADLVATSTKIDDVGHSITIFRR